MYYVYYTVEPPTTDSLYCGNLHNADIQEDAVPNLSLLFIVDKQRPYSRNLPTLNYGHQSQVPTDKINTNFHLKVDSLD